MGMEYGYFTIMFSITKIIIIVEVVRLRFPGSQSWCGLSSLNAAPSNYEVLNFQCYS
jgi:hypothetical protein